MPFKNIVDVRAFADRLAAAAERRAARKAERSRVLGGAAKHVPQDPADRPFIGRQALDGVEAYWRDKIGAGHVPLRRAIDPAGIATALPASMILERIAPGIARIRVAGQQIGKICGMDPRGMPLSVLFDADSRTYLSAHLEAAFAGPALVSLPMTLSRGRLRKPVVGQLLILPLDDGSGAITRALAVLGTEADVRGHAPVRLGIRTDLPLRCEVLPAPLDVVAAYTPPPVRTEPTVAQTRERRRKRDEIIRRFKPFQVVDGDGLRNPLLDAAEPRPTLSLVVSNT